MKPPEQQQDQKPSDDMGFGGQEGCVWDACVRVTPDPNSLSGPIKTDFIILPIFCPLSTKFGDVTVVLGSILHPGITEGCSSLVPLWDTSGGRAVMRLTEDSNNLNKSDNLNPALGR